MRKSVEQAVERYFHIHDYNCTRTELLILGDHLQVNLSSQVLDSSIGMHGAGGYQVQCGLVEGALMFIGIFGKERKVPAERIVEACYTYGFQFEQHFKSLLCPQLRPLRKRM